MDNLEFYDAPVNDMAFSPWFPNGELLATAADRTITIFDINNMPKRVYVAPDHQEPVSRLTFSNNGLLASAAENIITIRSVDAAWDEIMHIEASSAITDISCCCYHELTKCDRSFLAYVTATGEIGVWDITRKEE